MCSAKLLAGGRGKGRLKSNHSSPLKWEGWTDTLTTAQGPGAFQAALAGGAGCQALSGRSAEEMSIAIKEVLPSCVSNRTRLPVRGRVAGVLIHVSMTSAT